MKNSKCLLLLFIFSTILSSCNPDELLSETQFQNINGVYASSGDQKNVKETGEDDDENTAASSGDQKNVKETGEDD